VPPLSQSGACESAYSHSHGHSLVALSISPCVSISRMR
jgi:hypothetical protein